MESQKLIETFIAQTHQIIAQVEKLKAYDMSALTWKSQPESWNILECLEHLNLYGEYYLPEFELQMKNSKTTPDAIFKNGFFGNYFANSMLPKGKLNKMKTFKDKNPLNEKLDNTVINKFLLQQATLLSLLERAKTVSLNKVKIRISIAKIMKLKLGDTFNFYINHMLRHMQQIEKIELALHK